MDSYLERIAEFGPVSDIVEITGLEVEEIREVAVAYARKTPALMIAGFGLQRHRHAGQAMRAVALLPALTGNVGIPGGGWQYANLTSVIVCVRPRTFPSAEGIETRSFPTSRFGRSLQEPEGPSTPGRLVREGEPSEPASPDQRGDPRAWPAWRWWWWWISS